VNAFQGEVSSDQRLFPRQQPQHGAIVPNPAKDGPPRGAGTLARQVLLANSRHAANPGNQRFFSKRHGDYYTAEPDPRPKTAKPETVFAMPDSQLRAAKSALVTRPGCQPVTPLQ